MSENDYRVGELRAQSAYCNANRRVVLVSAEPEVSDLVCDLEVVRFYPDMTDEFGSHDEATFKIQVRRRPAPNGA
jgi:hypothetical protein